MRIRVLPLTVSALVSGVLLSACAGGGSSVTQSTGTVPSTVQRGTVLGGQAEAGRRAHSGVRRTLSVPTCSTPGENSFVGGTDSNVAGGQDAVVGGGGGNQACDDWSVIAGGYDNAVSGVGGPYDSFIGGGEFNLLTGNDTDSAIVAGSDNEVTIDAAAIVAGVVNSTAGEYSLVGAGFKNNVTGGGKYGFIGAGLFNSVSGEGGYIAAGGYNTVSGEGAVIDGGFNSTAAGAFATIPGGYVNSAGGTYSFAAGARASAAQTGTFVWSDGSDGDAILTSSRAYQFLARASGGFTLYTNAASTVGAQLAAGSGTWASLSDRNAKTNIVPLDDATVLDTVAALPISRWSYTSEPGVRHVGPMAQDFYAAFKVGEDNKHITSIDEDGVALAAIKALHRDNAALHARVGGLGAENARLRRELAAERAHDRRVDAELARIAGALQL